MNNDEREMLAWRTRLMHGLITELAEMVTERVKQMPDLTEAERCEIGHLSVLSYAINLEVMARPEEMKPEDYLGRETAIFHASLKQALGIGG